MELICTEQYNDIRFTLEVGDFVSKISFIDDEFKASLLKDYPQKFKLIKTEKDSELKIENKEDSLAKKIIKK